MKADNVVIYRRKNLCDCTDEEVVDAQSHLVKKIARMKLAVEIGGRMANLLGDYDIARTAMTDFEKEKADCEAIAKQLKAELEKRHLAKKGV